MKRKEEMMMKRKKMKNKRGWKVGRGGKLKGISGNDDGRERKKVMIKKSCENEN